MRFRFAVSRGWWSPAALRPKCEVRGPHHSLRHRVGVQTVLTGCPFSIFAPMWPLLGVMQGCSLSSGAGKSALMNTDSRSENRAHERVGPTISGPRSPMLFYQHRCRWRESFENVLQFPGGVVATPGLQNVRGRSWAMSSCSDERRRRRTRYPFENTSLNVSLSISRRLPISFSGVRRSTLAFMPERTADESMSQPRETICR